MKKFLMVLTIVLVVCNSTMIFASSDSLYLRKLDEIKNQPTLSFEELLEQNPRAKILDEYDLFMDVYKASNSELTSRGLSQEQIEALRSFNPVQKLYDLSRLSEYDLSKDYTSEEIKYIKSFSHLKIEEINVESIRPLSAGVALSIRPASVWENQQGMRLVLEFNWAWNGAPYFTQTDLLAFAWGNDFYADEISSTMTIEYKDINNNYITKRVFALDKSSFMPNSGCGFKFPQSYAPNALRSISSGRGFIVMVNPNIVRGTEIICKYGHSTMSIDPTISISKFPVSIAFSFFVEEMAFDRTVY